MKRVIYFAILFLLFLLWPFAGFVTSLVMLFRNEISREQQTASLIVASLFWGLLAFTQKSLAAEDTDCIRYYYSFEYFEGFRPLEVFGFLNFAEMINFVFYPVSSFIVALTDNVQSVSFLWTFIVYFLTFLSVRRLMMYYDCYTNKKFARLVLALTFCFIFFVQVSELLKQASAFAVFFYGLTLFMTRGSKIVALATSICAIGLHPTSIMLVPLFFYKHIHSGILFIVALCLFFASQFVDIIGFLMSMLPMGNYTAMIMERFGGGADQGGTMYYFALQFLLLAPAIYLLFSGKTRDKKTRYGVNVVILYFLICSLNIGNLTAYLRFTIFAHWLYALVTILLLKNIEFPNYRLILKALVLCMFLMNTRWTMGRTTPGGYASSYMDNSIVNIVFSTSYDYLTIDYRK